ncbi:MAG: ATP-binding cassette domain-containing protein, partial [Actinomycetota bacterium]
VLFASHDVTRLGPERRGQLGLIRSFQDARLFPTLTVLESVALALERADPTWFLRSVLGGHAAERRKKERAREIIGMMGLDGYRSRQISELSTGTRRIAELACLVALEPTLLLLDEPSSGIAQAETEELGTLLVRLREFLGVTLVVIEHDVPLIMGISDRVVAMESGRIIADGPPEVVRHDPQVVESYIGGDVRSVLRSGVGAGELEGRVAAGGRCTVVTRAGSRCSRAAGPDGRCVQHRRQAVSAGSAK